MGPRFIVSSERLVTSTKRGNVPFQPDQSLQRSYTAPPSSEYFDHTERSYRAIFYNTPKMSITKFMLMALALKYFRNFNIFY